MLNSYLEKSRELLLEDMANASERKKELDNSLKENIKFIQLLEETSDPNYAAFTPREINGRNQQKIRELKEEQQKISDDLEDVQREISDLTYKIDEINSVIKVAKEDGHLSSDRSKEYSSDVRLKILETQENERQRIARDLHDGIVQSYTSLAYKAELCYKLIDVDPVRCRLELSSLSKNLRKVIEDLRCLIYDLRPMSFDDIGFDTTVKSFLDRLKSSSGMDFSYQVEGEPYKLSNLVAISLLRIIQEACTNSYKYAEASNVLIILKYDEDSLELSIADDGKGIDLSTLPKGTREDNSGFGLSMMKERVYLLSGTFDIQSDIGEGCTIKVKIPLNQEDELEWQ
jgi:two-component system sensor histidine kinase DegS